MAETKQCFRCGEFKPIEQFYTRPSSKDGLGSWCKACTSLSGQVSKLMRKGVSVESPVSVIKRYPSLAERLWLRVEKTEGCWEWQGPKYGGGYGYIGGGPGRHMLRTHRAAWEVTHGCVPDGMDVLHICDNPSCCRPDHLFLGTDVDNARDRMRKGRSSKLGSNRKHLTSEQVRAIREQYSQGLSKNVLAHMFGVSRGWVAKLVHGGVRLDVWQENSKSEIEWGSQQRRMWRIE